MSGYPQQEVFFRVGAVATVEHPHPLPPLDLTAASCAQQAVVPAGAGPPQHPASCVARGSFALVESV